MELRKTFQYRSLWIGAALLWITFFHSGFSTGSVLLELFKIFGYGGVDICLFASGIGCYYSLEKDPDILRFLKRRICRLGPVYLCFIVPWLIWHRCTGEMPFTAVIGNLLGIQTFVSWTYHFNWYISCLLVCYLCIPYLKRITDSVDRSWQDWLVCLLLVAAGIPFWNTDCRNLIILSRLPVLYAGLLCAKKAKQGYVLKPADYLISLLAAGFGAISLLVFQKYMPDLLLSCGMNWYPFFLIAPGTCILLSLVAEKTERSSLLCWINKALQWAGYYSFELYLVHIFLFEELLPEIMDRFSNVSNNLLWMIGFFAAVCGTVLLNRITYGLMHFLQGRKNKSNT